MELLGIWKGGGAWQHIHVIVWVHDTKRVRGMEWSGLDWYWTENKHHVMNECACSLSFYLHLCGRRWDQMCDLKTHKFSRCECAMLLLLLLLLLVVLHAVDNCVYYVCIEMTYSNLIIWMYPIKWTICLAVNWKASEYINSIIQAITTAAAATKTENSKQQTENASDKGKLIYIAK